MSPPPLIPSLRKDRNSLTQARLGSDLTPYTNLESGQSNWVRAGLEPGLGLCSGLYFFKKIGPRPGLKLEKIFRTELEQG